MALAREVTWQDRALPQFSSLILSAMFGSAVAHLDKGGPAR